MEPRTTEPESLKISSIQKKKLEDGNHTVPGILDELGFVRPGSNLGRGSSQLVGGVVMQVDMLVSGSLVFNYFKPEFFLFHAWENL